MLFLAKAALGLTATLAFSAAYLFHEGLIKVDVDEYQGEGSHIHLWVPAAAVNLGLQVVPHRHLERAARQLQQFLPALREIAKELRKYPNAQFVQVKEKDEQVDVALVDGKIQIDVVDPEETIHLQIPIQTLEDVSDRLESSPSSI